MVLGNFLNFASMLVTGCEIIVLTWIYKKIDIVGFINFYVILNNQRISGKY